MNENQTQAVTKEAPRPIIPVGTNGLILQDMESLWRFSTAVAKSGLAPKGIQTAEAVFVAVQMGLEVGLSPMCALQNIAVINGRPALWGDAQLAVVRGTGELEMFVEWYEAGGKQLARNPDNFDDTTTAVCKLKRRGYSPREISFSVADAKRAGLWQKEGPWRQYPGRMLRMRARAFALRDEFGDALRGMRAAEELQGATIDIDAEVAKPNFLEAPPTLAGADVPAPTRKRRRAAPETASPDAQEAQGQAAENHAPQPPTQPDLKEEVMTILQDGKFTFEDLCFWACDHAWITSPEEWKTIADVPPLRLSHTIDRKVEILGDLAAMYPKRGAA